MNKHKKLPLILAGFSCLALAGVGFSTWIIGYQTTTMNLDGVGVDIEETKYAGFSFKLNLAKEEKLHICEGNTGLNNDGTPSFGSANLSGETPKFYVDATLEITVTKTFVQLYDFSQINFTLLKEGASIATNETSTDTINHRSGGSPWTYVALKTSNASIGALPADIATSNGTWTSAVANASKEEYKLTRTNKVRIEFDWGTYFNSKAPTTFYNSFTSGEPDLRGYLDKVELEMKQMHTDLNGKNFYLKADVPTTLKDQYKPAQKQ